MKCEKCGEEMNECTVDGVDQVSCVFCSEVNEYDRGWNEALEAVNQKSYGILDPLEYAELTELLNTLKK